MWEKDGLGDLTYRQTRTYCTHGHRQEVMRGGWWVISGRRDRGPLEHSQGM
jgi:hypothetical protein